MLLMYYVWTDLCATLPVGEVILQKIPSQSASRRFGCDLWPLYLQVDLRNIPSESVASRRIGSDLCATHPFPFNEDLAIEPPQKHWKF